MVKLANELGQIAIAGEVFTNLTGEAATNCFGVKGMTIGSLADGLVHLLKPEYKGKGVSVIYNNDRTISIELHIAVDRGVNIPVICESIMHRVGYEVSNGTGVTVKRVDIYVDKMLLG